MSDYNALVFVDDGASNFYVGIVDEYKAIVNEYSAVGGVSGGFNWYFS